MSPLHWLLLAVVVAVVGCAYWYLRAHKGGDPWRGMDESDDSEAAADADNGVSLNGDSYIVGVRTLTPGRADSAAESGDSPNTAGQYSEAQAEAAWSAYKDTPETSATPAPDEGRSEPRPSAPRHPEPEPSAQAPAEAPPAAREHPEPEQPAPTVAARVENIRPVHPPAGEEQIFMLHVASPDGRQFDGPDIHAALDAEGLKFGLNDFYHRVTDANGEIESVYCVANMLNPGALDPVDQDHLSTPGLTLFLILPGAIEGVRAMRDMMETANGISERLGGQVLDDQRSLLKAQTAQYMLDQIADIDRRARLRAAR